MRSPDRTTVTREVGEDEGDDVPPTLAPAAAVPPPAENGSGFDGFDGLAGYALSRSLVEIDDKDNEFRFSIDDVQPVPTPVSIGRPPTDLQKEKEKKVEVAGSEQPSSLGRPYWEL